MHNLNRSMFRLKESGNVDEYISLAQFGDSVLHTLVRNGRRKGRNERMDSKALAQRFNQQHSASVHPNSGSVNQTFLNQQPEYLHSIKNHAKLMLRCSPLAQPGSVSLGYEGLKPWQEQACIYIYLTHTPNVRAHTHGSAYILPFHPYPHKSTLFGIENEPIRIEHPGAQDRYQDVPVNCSYLAPPSMRILWMPMQSYLT